MRRQIADLQSGTLNAVDENRVRWIHAFAPLASSVRNRQVSVVLEIPEGLALAASKRIFIRNVALLAVLALMAVMVIWWAGDMRI